jgi:tripartite-type tricarboxylate transporter receptor subunit TctC
MRRRSLLALPALLAFPSLARGQAAFSRPVRIIVPFAPGGTSDILARLIAPRMSEILRQPVVIENRTGANGNIGADLVAKSPPDGHTLLLTDAASLAATPALVPNLSYSPTRDLAPVTLVAFAPYIFGVHPAVPATDVAGFVAFARRPDARVNFAHSGVGSGPHLTGLVLARHLGITWEAVAYRGGAPAVQAVFQGECHAVVNGATATLSFVTAGQIRALAVSGTSRLPALPSVQCFGELSMPTMLVESGTWQALFATGGTPQPVVDAVHRAAASALADPAIAARIVGLGGEVRTTEPAALGRWFATNTEAWGNVVRENNVRME